MASLNFYKNNIELKDWTENDNFTPSYIIKPFHLDDLIEAVKLASESELELRVRGFGTAKPSTCATPHVIVDMTTFNKPVKVDTETMQVEVEAGMTVKHLNEYLQRKGLALSVQGVWQHVTIGGAVVTGTHGTGCNYGVIGSYLLGATLVLASGEVKRVSQKQDGNIMRFIPGSLGMLGILATVTIQCEKMFKLHMKVETKALREILDSVEKDRLTHEHYTFNFCPGVEGAQVTYSNRTNEEDRVHPPPSILSDIAETLGGGLVEFCFLIGSVISSAAHQANRLERYTFYDDNKEAIGPGYQLMTTESIPKMSPLEWAIPVEHTKDAIRDIIAWVSQSKFPVHNAVQMRFSAKDDLPLSPAFNRDVCWIQIFTRKPCGKFIDQTQLHKAFITVMKRYDGRPHWAKWVDDKESYTTFFPEWSKFKEMQRMLDPKGLFLNECLRKIIDL